MGILWDCVPTQKFLIAWSHMRSAIMQAWLRKRSKFPLNFKLAMILDSGSIWTAQESDSPSPCTPLGPIGGFISYTTSRKPGASPWAGMAETRHFVACCQCISCRRSRKCTCAASCTTRCDISQLKADFHDCIWGSDGLGGSLPRGTGLIIPNGWTLTWKHAWVWATGGRAWTKPHPRIKRLGLWRMMRWHIRFGRAYLNDTTPGYHEPLSK